MDPVTVIGLVASLEQLAMVATKIFYNIYHYYDAVRGAPKRSQELRQEMLIMSDQLNFLVEVLKSMSTSSAPSVSASLADAISELETMLNDMNQRTQVSTSRGLNRLKWPFTQTENTRLLSRVARYKSILDSALNIHTA